MSDVLAAMTGGWPHKWLVLLVLSLWLFLFRFRLLSLLLSRALCFHYYHRELWLRSVDVQVQHMTLRPLRFTRIELRVHSGIRVECAEITVETHFRDFFLSFGHNKILVLLVDGLQIDVDHVDDELLRQALQKEYPPRPAGSSAPTAPLDPQRTTHEPRKSGQVMGLMRFVDIRMSRLRLSMRGFELCAEFQCCDLSVHIKDVLLPQNVLHLQVEASAVHLSSRRHRSGTPRSPMKPLPASMGSEREELTCHVQYICAVFDIRLTDQVCVGCRVTSAAPKEPIFLHISTRFVEHLCLKRIDLIRRGLFPIPMEIWKLYRNGADTRGTGTERRSGVEASVSTKAVNPFAFSAEQIAVCADIVHQTHTGLKIPLRCTMQIMELTQDTVGRPNDGHENVTLHSTPPEITTGPIVKVDVRELLVLTDDPTAQSVVELTTAQMRIDQSQAGQGSVTGHLGALQLALNGQLCETFHSFVAFPDILSDSRHNALQCMHDMVADRCQKAMIPLKKKCPIEWHVECELDSWGMDIFLDALGQGSSVKDLCLVAQHTTISVCLPPRSSELPAKQDISIHQIRASTLLQRESRDGLLSGMHEMDFMGVEISVVSMKALPSRPIRSIGTNVKIAEGSVNGFQKGQTIQNRRVPAGYLSGFSLQYIETMSPMIVNNRLTIDIFDLDVMWSHQEHFNFMEEWQVLTRMMERTRCMLIPPERSSEQNGGELKLDPHGLPKELGVTLTATAAKVNLLEVGDVSESVAFILEKCDVSFYKNERHAASHVACAFVMLQWDDARRVVEAMEAKFERKSGAVENQDAEDSRVDAHNTLSFSELHMWLRPKRRLLMLAVRLDELANGTSKANQDILPYARKPISQTFSFACALVHLEISSYHGIPVVSSQDVSGPAPEIYAILMDKLNMEVTMNKSFTLSDTVLSYLHVTRRDDTCRSRLMESLQRLLCVDGSISARSIELSSASRRSVFCCRLLHIEFALSDIARSDAADLEAPLPSSYSALPKHITIFDVSALTKQCSVTMETSTLVILKTILPVFADVVSTREGDIETGEPAESGTTADDWRLRYVGTLDIGINHATVIIPCESTFSEDHTIDVCADEVVVEDTSERSVCIVVTQLGFGCRQFQKLSLHYQSVQANLIDDMDCDSSDGDETDPSKRLLYLPHTKLDTVIHWREDISYDRDEQPTQQFGLSFELQLKGRSVAASPQVPTFGEPLLALNWDLVYPLLVQLFTDDDRNQGPSAVNEKERLPSVLVPPVPTASSNGRGELAFRCTGVEWNISLDVIQIAWWDSNTPDAGLLVIANDLLSHGIARWIVAEEPQAARWGVSETTVYLDLLRGYVLEELIPSDRSSMLAYDAFPFKSVSCTRFFIETAGISFREAAAPKRSQPGDNLDDTNTFHEIGYIVVPKLHDHFAPVEYTFRIGVKARLSRTDFMPHAFQFHQPPSIITDGVSMSPQSPPKSPKMWTQSVRTKLARLKRRTASTDNLLLNDGSRPIQVDSMKLLWTLKTRDSVFYMLAVTNDSVNVILEAHRLQESLTMASSSEATKVDSPRTGQPTGVNKHADLVNGNDHHSQRRTSTRETLLDLLHQGKLGMKQSSGSEEHVDRICSEHRKPDRSRFGDMPELEELVLSTVIAIKKYTVDVHDAQINMLDETSRSSVLIAAAHIHLDLGYDDTQTTAVSTLTFSCVTGHVAPHEIGVVWYAHAKSGTTRTPASSDSSSLKKVMEECSLTTTYSQVLATGVTAVEMDLSFMQLSTDCHQFYQLLNVLQNVLLAPPTITCRQKPPRSTVGSDGIPGTGEGEKFRTNGPSTPTASNLGPLTKKTRAQLIEELRQRETKARGVSRTKQVAALRLIAFRADGCTFRLRSNPESLSTEHEFVDIRVEGITGSHIFFLNQCSKLSLNLQWMEISNLRPGPSSIAFDDAMSVLRAKLLIDQRQGQLHAMSRDHFSFDNQKGMLTIRAESGPVTRVLGRKLRVMEVLEISIFPEIPNVIVIQLAADFYELIYKFFFEGISTPAHQDGNSEHAIFGRRAPANSTVTPSFSSIPGTSNFVGPSSHHSNSPTPSKSRMLGSASSSILTHRKSAQTPCSPINTSLPVDASNSFLSPSSSTGSNYAREALDDTNGADDDDWLSMEQEEVYYMKYVRVGNVRLRINCNGFFVSLNNFDLDLPQFVCQSKLTTWKKLVHKFESHLKWHVTKESASTGLSHFKNKLLKWTPSGGSIGERNRDKAKKDEGSATTNAHLLFGPYSGELPPKSTT